MRFAIVLAAALALAACNGAKKEDPNARAAGGEVLQGTISDAMIDLDKSAAQAPLAPHKAAKGDAKDAKKGTEASTASDDEATPAADASPAAKPSASAKPSAAAD